MIRKDEQEPAETHGKARSGNDDRRGDIRDAECRSKAFSSGETANPVLSDDPGSGLERTLGGRVG